MLKLNKISPIELRNSDSIETLFPLASMYLLDPLFIQPKYEWFYITDDRFSTDEERNTWLGLICLTEDKFIYGDNLHLSVLEVAEPIHNLGVGTSIVNMIIDVAMKNYYKTLTLQLRDSSLESFYERFGFKKNQNNGGVEFYQLNL